jgi:hypothetical protein
VLGKVFSSKRENILFFSGINGNYVFDLRFFSRYSERRDVAKLRKGVNYILKGIQDMIVEDLELISLVEAKFFFFFFRVKFDFLNVFLRSITCNDDEIIQIGVNNNPMIIAALANFNPQEGHIIRNESPLKPTFFEKETTS